MALLRIAALLAALAPAAIAQDVVVDGQAVELSGGLPPGRGPAVPPPLPPDKIPLDVAEVRFVACINWN